MKDAKKSGNVLAEILDQIKQVNTQVSQTATTGEITNNILQVTEVLQITAKGSIGTENVAVSENKLCTFS